MDRQQHTEQVAIIFGAVKKMCMALKTHDVVAIHHRPNKGALWRPYTPSTPPKITSASSGGCTLSIWSVGAECKASCGALGGNFHQRRPWLWRLWCQLCFVIKILKIAIKIIKLVVCNQFLYVILHIVKHIAVHVRLMVVWPKPKLCSMASPNHWTPAYLVSLESSFNCEND
jgi:hypothetical protein